MQKDFSEIAKKLGWKSICEARCEAPYPDTHELTKEKLDFFSNEHKGYMICEKCRPFNKLKFNYQFFRILLYPATRHNSIYLVATKYRCNSCDYYRWIYNLLDKDFNIILDN